MIHPESLFCFKPDNRPCTNNHYTYYWNVPDSLPYFDGHFQGKPILPGIAIIDGSFILIQEILNKTDISIKSIKNGKFFLPIMPNMNLAIHLECLSKDSWKIDWTDAKDTSVYFAKMILNL